LYVLSAPVGQWIDCELAATFLKIQSKICKKLVIGVRIAAGALRPHRKIYKYCARIISMTYTEVKEINRRKYFYRVRSMRNGKKFKKQRIYLGKNLSKEKLAIKELEADNKLNSEKKLKTLSKIIPKIREVLKKNNVKKAGVFGSYVRGEEKKDSDIDILIEPPKGIGFGFVRIQFELEDKLKKNVDLLSYGAIHSLLKKRILNEEIRII